MGSTRPPEGGRQNKGRFRVEVVGSNPAGPITVIDRAHQEKIVNFLFYLKKQGYRKSTLEGYSDVFKHLARNVDIDYVEAVKAFIANKPVSEARKQVLVDKYAQYCKWRKLQFDKPIYKAVKCMHTKSRSCRGISSLTN